MACGIRFWRAGKCSPLRWVLPVSANKLWCGVTRTESCRRWKTAARTAVPVCRWAGISAIVSPAGITAWKWPGMAKLKMFRRSTNVRWWASSACAATTSRKRMARYSCGLRPPPTSSPSRSPSRKSWPIATNTATSSAPPRGNATISTRWKT